MRTHGWNEATVGSGIRRQPACSAAQRAEQAGGRAAWCPTEDPRPSHFNDILTVVVLIIKSRRSFEFAAGGRSFNRVLLLGAAGRPAALRQAQRWRLSGAGCTWVQALHDVAQRAGRGAQGAAGPAHVIQAERVAMAGIAQAARGNRARHRVWAGAAAHERLDHSLGLHAGICAAMDRGRDWVQPGCNSRFWPHHLNSHRSEWSLGRASHPRSAAHPALAGPSWRGCEAERQLHRCSGDGGGGGAHRPGSEQLPHAPRAGAGLLRHTRLVSLARPRRGHHGQGHGQGHGQAAGTQGCGRLGHGCAETRSTEQLERGVV